MSAAVAQVASLALCVGACFGAAAIGGAFTATALPDWYSGLAKPAWTPPNAVFGPVWSVLYLLMGISAWMVWRSGPRREAVRPLAVFGLQLLLNAAWSGLFFGWRSPAAALADIVLLWGAIAATIVLFRRRSPPAALLMLPCLAWVTFAAALNLAIWRMNR